MVQFPMLLLRSTVDDRVAGWRTDPQRINYAWPGNVRELRNVIEQAVLLTQSDIIDATHLAFCPALTRPEQDGAHTLLSSKGLPEGGVDLEQVEKDLIIQALDQTAWNITQAAKLLGLSRDTLRYRMEKHALDTPSQG